MTYSGGDIELIILNHEIIYQLKTNLENTYLYFDRCGDNWITEIGFLPYGDTGQQDASRRTISVLYTG
jgi:hypothetical protein